MGFVCGYGLRLRCVSPSVSSPCDSLHPVGAAVDHLTVEIWSADSGESSVAADLLGVDPMWQIPV